MVTGANGFVGIQVVRDLLAMPQHELVAIDSLRYGPWRFSDAERKRFAHEVVDIRDPGAVAAAMARYQPEAVIHLAAIHFIPECERLPHDAVSTNVQGTVNLLHTCPPGCRFVFTSSAAVYKPLETAHNEDASAVGPVDVYGYTKLHGEDFVRHFARDRGFNAAIVRLFNVIGPGETNPHVLPEIIRQLKAGTRKLSLGNVHPKRDYIHVADVSSGFIRIATTAVPDPVTVVNLGSGASFSVEELVNRLGGIIGEPIKIEVDPARVRAVDRPNLLSDNGRLRELYNWQTEHPLDAALEGTWNDPALETLQS
jgi:UDP-glucose 4-epimerase